jgi:hypothetical protein
MTMPRSKIVDPEITPWYHCISQCARQAFLLDSPRDRRRQWLEERLRELTTIFGIDVGSYAFLQNHLHVLVHLDTRRVKGWSRTEVLRRWARLYPPRDGRRKPLKNLKRWIREQLKDRQQVSRLRQRLGDLGWFMKSLKEPFSRLVNQQEGCRGTLWAGRYKSIAILDEAALLATCVYVDLNPFAAGMSRLPELAMFTSLYARIDYCRQRGRGAQLQASLAAAEQGSVASARVARGLERGQWLCPMDDPRDRGSDRVGILSGFSLGSYLLLVDGTSRVCRAGKARVRAEAASLLERLGIERQRWESTLQQLFSRPYPVGVFFSFHRARLRHVAEARGIRHVANVNGCRT